ncbi:uncharacterized protein FFB20_05143 [Fusarium fujikuroi]|uniref:Uncharacterized protein n=1 Tax=Gibberella fujikuroi (strain CBS 195.34 / IMI 58289 / NRRL A-6831) TaxID=1279085 RepID=S0DIY3_GIBF5|nr:uncharacterized protein FFUJ_01303 [Fusarium fujikuroi IMI 58289]SCN71988.1 uncharacterized protein FFC1_01390 [Fusarium fujikuroi]CCT62171.1 uncharacterized protein FFUJ_01303 [Fusarium fujikuroi IMI 58289]SCN75430.1 uncharacterized protein FFM5_01345 [Fusarium fujikuroi]SCN76057.1 uncharacterized protein FFB20_05143 [Fusarium fujikuroi]SCO28071.1 uncharacterized protein FFMR_00840 [Fusarium fujikuroi]
MRTIHSSGTDIKAIKCSIYVRFPLLDQESLTTTSKLCKKIISMCVYGRVVFKCAHERWGICVKQCQTAKDFRDGKLNHDCVIKKPHVPTSRRIQTNCNKCITLDGKLDRAKKSIDDVKQKLKRIEERKIRKRNTEENKIDNRKKVEKKDENRDSNETNSWSFGTGLGSITEESEVEDESSSDGSSQGSSQVTNT